MVTPLGRMFSNSPPTQSVLLLLTVLSFVAVSYVTARSLQPLVDHPNAKRFYMPMAVLESLMERRTRDAPTAAATVGDNLALIGLPGTLADYASAERKRTVEARLEYLDSLVPRQAAPKRKMFFSPLGYMSASARRLNQNNPGNRAPSNNEDAASPGFRYG